MKKMLMFLLVFALLSSTGFSWCDSTYKYKQEINLTYPVAASLTGFPVLVEPNLTPLYNDAHIQEDADDIIFCDSDDVTKLAYEREKAITNNTNNLSQFWVKVNLTSGNDKTIYMYYGNSTVGYQGNDDAVWDSDFSAVWHMTEEAAEDSTSNNNDGVVQDGVAQNENGKIDGANDFDGTNDEINFSDSSSLSMTSGNDQLTFELWSYYRNSTQNTAPHIELLDKVDEYGLGLETSSTPYEWSFFTYGSNIDSESCAAINTETWQHIAVTWDEGTQEIKMYVNGTLNCSASIADTSTDTANPLTLGGKESADNYFGAIIDEVRISKAIRSAEWIEATALQPFTSSFSAEKTQGSQPTIHLISPPDLNTTGDTTPDFIFNATSNTNTTMSCELLLNGTGYGKNNTVANNTNTTITCNTTLNFTSYQWRISCDDGVGVGSSGYRTITIAEAGLTVYVYDEKTSVPMNFNITITNTTSSFNKTNQSTPTSYKWNTTPNGLVTVQLKSFNQSYSTRYYYTTITDTSLITLNAYLLADGQYNSVPFYVLTSTGAGIDNVLVTAQKNFGSGYVTVAQRKTDATGTAVLPLNDDTTYYMKFEKDGYVNQYQEIVPTASYYTVYLTSGYSLNFTHAFEDISYRIEPYGSYLHNPNETFTFTISSSDGVLQWYAINTTLDNGTELGFSNTSGSPNGGDLSLSLNLTPHSGHYLYVYGLFQKTGYGAQTVYSKYYIWSVTEGGNFTFANLIEELPKESAMTKTAAGLSTVILSVAVVGIAAPFTMLGAGVAGVVPLAFAAYADLITWGQFFVIILLIFGVLVLFRR